MGPKSGVKFSRVKGLGEPKAGDGETDYTGGSMQTLAMQLRPSQQSPSVEHVS
jgi:hypothetical protein